MLRGVSHPEPVNVALNTETSLLQLIGELEQVSGARPDVRFLPPRAGDILHSRADDSQLRRLFPELRPVGLREGLGATLGWARDVRSSASPAQE